MCLARIRKIGLVIFSFCAFLLFLQVAQAQTPYKECGDINSDGKISLLDHIYVMEYLWNGGPAPLDPTRDIDGRAGLSSNDISWWTCAFNCDFDWVMCDVMRPELVPVVDSAFELRFPNRIPANYTSSAITLIADNPTAGTTAFTLVLRFRIDGLIPVFDSINYPYSQDALNTNDQMISVDHDSAEIVLGAIGSLSPMTSDTLAQLFLSYPSAPSIRALDVNYVRRAPLQAPAGDSSLISMFGSAPFSHNATVPLLVGSCCMTAGDANYDGRLTIADVTFTIARIFSGGPPPICIDASDANGDGDLSIGDVTHMLARIFNDGPPAFCQELGI